LHCDALCCNVLQRVAACCSVLQRVAACCSVLQRVEIVAVTVLRLLQCPCRLPDCCSVLQCASVCYSVLQCAAVCCSVLQCVPLCFHERGARLVLNLCVAVSCCVLQRAAVCGSAAAWCMGTPYASNSHRNARANISWMWSIIPLD